MKISHAISFCICTLFIGTSAHGDTLHNYAYAWPLTVDGDSAAWQVEPSAAVYAAISDAQLRDLEVVDGDGNPVPTAPRDDEAPGIAVSAYAPLPLFALPARTNTDAANDGSVSLRIERAADGRLRSVDAGIGAANSVRAATPANEFVVDASALTAPIDSVRVDWDEGADAVNARFAVSASDDLQTWRTLVANAGVLGLSQNGMRLSRHDIGLGGARALYLRLQRLDGGAALPNMRVSARSFAVSTPVRAARQWLGADPVANATDPAAPASATYLYSLPAALPAEALKIELASDNSIAHVNVSSRVSDAQSAWTPRTDFTAFRLNASGQNHADGRIGNDEVLLGGAPRSSEWRVVATPPLDRAPTLNLAWRPQRFVFLAQGHGPYRLVAGSAKTRRADYPVNIALTRLRSKLGKDWQPPLAQLGARETLVGADAFKPVPAATPPRDWKTWLLWAVLIAAAAVIGGLALSLLRAQKS